MAVVVVVVVVKVVVEEVVLVVEGVVVVVGVVTVVVLVVEAVMFLLLSPMLSAPVRAVPKYRPQLRLLQQRAVKGWAAPSVLVLVVGIAVALMRCPSLLMLPLVCRLL